MNPRLKIYSKNKLHQPFVAEHLLNSILARPIASAEQEYLAAHRLPPCGLHLIEDEKPASCADRWLAPNHQPLLHRSISFLNMRAMDFE
jgi:hypothetical protein